jgi:23S rRNA pseudouridine1911/1915/1917 synthase
LREENALVNGSPAKPSLKLRGDEQVTIIGGQPRPLRAMAENIPLDVIYEDDDLAVINKPAGMMVHAGAGATDDERNRGTLVNALLHRLNELSEVGGELRPGIVHRLDKETSGLIIVAKNDVAHRKLAQQFSSREIRKRYTALVHGWPTKDRGSINLPISRDQVRRTRMTTRGSGGRSAITHYQVRRRIDSPYGKFAFLEVGIETGRTHQIRVHMSSIGHPVVGDTLYGAAKELKRGDPTRLPKSRRIAIQGLPGGLSLARNFLHAAGVEFDHPRTGDPLKFEAPLPHELVSLLQVLEE